MRIVFLISILLAVACVQLAAQGNYGCQFKNAGFEEWANWNNSNNKPEPLNWHSFKSGTGALMSFTPQCLSRSEITRPGSKGKCSVKLEVKKVLGIKANGAIVNGRVNASSMSAAHFNNYFFTETSNPLFCTPVETIPDSLTVWFCFRAVSTKDSAFVHTAIHGDDNFRLISDGTYYPPEMLVAKGDGYLTTTTLPSGNDYKWVRMSVPFIVDKECVHKTPKYILASFSTNNRAGKGNEVDELYMDDILLIYNPTLTTGKLANTNFTLSKFSEFIPLEVSFTIKGTMSPNNLNKAKNKVIVQLSDASGSFSTPTIIGSMETDISGSLQCKIPKEKVKSGQNYRVRVTTTNYPMTAEAVEITFE